jgi:hypothetical protein
MDPKLSARVLVALSIAYGVTVGILGMVDSGAITAFAVVGALVLGALWAVRGMLMRRDQSAGQ